MITDNNKYYSNYTKQIEIRSKNRKSFISEDRLFQLGMTKSVEVIDLTDVPEKTCEIFVRILENQTFSGNLSLQNVAELCNIAKTLNLRTLKKPIEKSLIESEENSNKCILDKLCIANHFQLNLAIDHLALKYAQTGDQETILKYLNNPEVVNIVFGWMTSLQEQIQTQNSNNFQLTSESERRPMEIAQNQQEQNAFLQLAKTKYQIMKRKVPALNLNQKFRQIEWKKMILRK